MNFQREHHNKIITILEKLNSDLFEECKVLFCGGTLLALDFEEYRESKDIDFACQIPTPGYRKLRSVIFNYGFEGLFNNHSGLTIKGETSSHDSIRILVEINQKPIKLEILAWKLFDLDSPRYPAWSPVPCISTNDCFSCKLLSNANRYMDNSVEARDLIDLAILRLQYIIPQDAIRKAEEVFEVVRPLQDAIQRFQEKEEFRERCFDNLKINSEYIPKVIDGIDLLAEDFDLSITKRTSREEHDEFF